jgi:hypothetical protein
MWKSLVFSALISGTVAATYAIGWVRGSYHSINYSASRIVEVDMAREDEVRDSFQCGYLNDRIDRGMPVDALVRKQWSWRRCDRFQAVAEKYSIVQ